MREVAAADCVRGSARLSAALRDILHSGDTEDEGVYGSTEWDAQLESVTAYM